MTIPARVLLLDGHAYAYRAFHAIRALSSPSGEPTNAIYGFIKTIHKLRKQLEPAYLAVVWDGGLAAERLAILPEYKAQRPPMPASLERQIEGIRSWLQASGMASLCRDGIEADDWIAVLARKAADEGLSVVIASSDKDFMQLVGPKVGLLNPNDKTDTVWGPEQVREKTGVQPSQVVDWLSLVGDTVDNIPGVPGVGVKTAAELLGQFGSLENLMTRLGEVTSPRLRASLEQSAGLLQKNREMIRLKDQLPIEFHLEGLAVGQPDYAKLRELYAAWGFSSLLRSLASAGCAAACDLFELAAHSGARAGK